MEVERMDERWEQVERLYHAALERDGEARGAFLDEACAGDEDLHREVASLLAYDDQSASFIESPALEVAARELGTFLDPQLDTRADLPESSRIGTYQMLSPLGKGGMGEVWLAHDTRLGRKVALKLLSSRFMADAEWVQRFEQEARSASAL